MDTRWGREAMAELVGMVTKPAYSASFPPPAHVRDALGLKRNGELQERWLAYLEEADDAFCAAGISEDKLSVKHFLNRMLGMKVGVQNRVFGHFTSELDAKIKKAKEEHKVSPSPNPNQVTPKPKPKPNPNLYPNPNPNQVRRRRGRHPRQRRQDRAGLP